MEIVARPRRIRVRLFFLLMGLPTRLIVTEVDILPTPSQGLG